MDFDFWQPVIPSMAEEHMEELRCATPSSLEHPAVVWRRGMEEEPIFVRPMGESELGVTFVCSVPLEVGERIEYAREAQSACRTTYQVTQCELLVEDIYRVCAHA